MKLIMKGSTGCEIGSYELGRVDSEEYNQNLILALRDFATFMQDGDSLEVIGQYEEEMV